MVNIGGMCCTIAIATGRSPGSDGINSASAVGPPVDTPMAITSIRSGGPAGLCTVPDGRAARSPARTVRSCASRAWGRSAAIRGSSCARISAIAEPGSVLEGFNT